MARIIALTAAVVALIATVFVATESAEPRVCKPELELQNLWGMRTKGFNICLFGKTNNLITDKMALASNTLWMAQAALNGGKCYCNQDCSPPQIVCQDAVDLGLGNITNGIAKIVYKAENWQFYCYCPQYAGDNPCNTPPIPSACEVV